MSHQDHFLLPSDVADLEIALDALSKYINTEAVLIGGGLATRFHAHQAGRAPPSWPFGDIDLELPGIESMSSAVQDEFLVGHVHYECGRLHSVVLAHPPTQLKVDLFFSRLPPVARRDRLTIGRHRLQVSTVEEQLVFAIDDLVRQIELGGLHPKRIGTMLLLSAIAEPGETQRLWRAFTNTTDGDPYFVASAALDAIDGAPAMLTTQETPQPITGRCASCSYLAGYEIASRFEYQSALGRLEVPIPAAPEMTPGFLSFP